VLSASASYSLYQYLTVRSPRFVAAGSASDMGISSPFERAVTEHGGTVRRVCIVLAWRHDARRRLFETFMSWRRCVLSNLP